LAMKADSSWYFTPNGLLEAKLQPRRFSQVSFVVQDFCNGRPPDRLLFNPVQ